MNVLCCNTGYDCAPAVSTNPGETVLTRIPSGAIWVARFLL
jgi:hypothetical protein